MNKKVFRLIKITLTILIATILVASIFVSQDEYHLETCEEDNCFYCTIIQIAQNIVSLSNTLIMIVMIGVLIYLFLSRLSKEKKVIALVSLVFQKVQLNE